MEPEKHDSPFQRKKNNMPANKSIQARQQLRDPNTGRFRDEHRQSGMPTDESIRKYERQTSVVSPPASYYDGTMSEENRELWAEGMDALDNSPYAGFSGGFDEQDDASIDGWRIHRRNTPTGNTVYEFRDAKSSTPNRVAYLIKQSDIDAGHSPTWLDERQRSFFNVLTNNKR